MKKSAKGSLKDAVGLPRALRGLPRHEAPARLLPAILARVGLIDRYWRLESPLGPVYVAHSKRGISMVSRASSARAFERRFRERLHDGDPRLGRGGIGGITFDADEPPARGQSCQTGGSTS